MSLLTGSNSRVKGVLDGGKFVDEAVSGRSSTYADDAFAVEFGCNVGDGGLSCLSFEIVLGMADGVPH